MNRQEVARELEQSFGMVPGFFKVIPDAHIGHMWQAMRNLQLRPGSIPPKYQQLIMLAVSTYAKCKYCTDFHTEIAKTMGANQAELAETALLTGHTADFSNFLGGMQYDFEAFKREVRAACAHVAKNGDGKEAQAQRVSPPR